MIKKLLIVLLFLFGLKNSPLRSQTLVSTLDHDTCLNKQFSIVFYIVLDSNLNVRCATPSTLAAIINTLNLTFAKICVSFVNCSTVYVPNYPYNRWKRSTTDPQVTSNWYTDKTINFWIVDSIKPEGTNPEREGYAYPPPEPGQTPKDVIVIEQFRGLSIVREDFYQTFHNMGHFFGLVHTYDELNPGNPANPGPPAQVFSHEFADGSNNTIHGDLLSDTEADPGPVAVPQDGKGDLYIRPLDNYMSFLKTSCVFTQQQYNLMARTIFKKRLYLH